MAINQLSRGVFIVSPEAGQEYHNSAAGNYTSQFTKNRGDQWEMAKQAALQDIASETSRYQAELQLYEKRNAVLDQRQLQIDRDLASLIRGEVKGQDAAYKTGEVEGTKRLKIEAGRQEAQAAMYGGRAPSSSTTTTTSGPKTTVSTRTGGGASSLDKAATEQVDLAVGRSGPVEDQYKKIVEHQGPGGFGGGKTQQERDAGTGQLFDDRIRVEADKLQSGGMSAEDALQTARASALEAIADKPTTQQMLVDRWTGAAKPDEGVKTVKTTPGGTSTSTRYDSGAAQLHKYENLGALPGAPQVDVETASRQAEIDRLNAMSAKIAEERAALQLPTYTAGPDYITRARNVAAGRFGPSRGSDAGYVQRNTLDTLLNLPQEQRDLLLEKYRQSVAAPTPAPQTTTTTETIGGTLAPTQTRSGPPVDTLPRLQLTPLEERMKAAGSPGTVELSGDIPLRGASDVDLGQKPEGVIEPYTDTPTSTIGNTLRSPLSADVGPGHPNATGLANSLALKYELDQYKAEADAARGRKQTLESLFPEGVPVEYAAQLQNAPSPVRPIVPPPVSPQFIPQTQAEQSNIQFNKRGVPYVDDLGQKQEGVIQTYPEVIAPKSGGLPLPSKPSVSNAPQSFPDATAKANAFMFGNKKAEDAAAVAQTLGTKVLGTSGKPSETYYLQQRYTEAKELADKPKQLDRLTASGIGKVVKAIFTANVSSKKTLQRSFEELAITYANSPEDLKKAHTILFALEMTSDNNSRPKE